MRSKSAPNKAEPEGGPFPQAATEAQHEGRLEDMPKEGVISVEGRQGVGSGEKVHTDHCPH